MNPDDLQRPEGNDLETNYEQHDSGMAVLEAIAESHGVDVEQVGIDERDNDGELIYDDAPDVLLHDGDEDIAYVDVKTKSSDDWMGWFNERHHRKYVEWSDEHGAPLFVFMLNVGDWSGFVARIDEDDDTRRSSEDPAIRPFPDGNQAVYIPESMRNTIEWFSGYLEASTE